MPNVVRLVNGGTIQVRTGVLQGIGPMGPTGPVGPVGSIGNDGPAGPVGPPGSITQYGSQFTMSSPQTLAVNSDTQVSTDTVQYDDLSAHSSSTNYALVTPGDYMLMAWVEFDLPNTGSATNSRAVWFQGDAYGTAARQEVCCSPTTPTHLSITAPIRLTTADTFHLYVRTNDISTHTMSTAVVSIERIGSGPQGIQGPPGAASSVPGPQGPQGAQGQTGSGQGPFNTYGGVHN